jgi:hypothetical protein
MIYADLIRLYSNDFVYDPSFASFFMDNTLIEVKTGIKIDQDLLVKIRNVLFESELTFNIDSTDSLGQEYSYRLQFLYIHDSIEAIVIKSDNNIDTIVFQFTFNVPEMFVIDENDFEVLVARLTEEFVFNDKVCKSIPVRDIITTIKARGILVLLNSDFGMARVFNDFYL